MDVQDNAATARAVAQPTPDVELVTVQDITPGRADEDAVVLAFRGHGIQAGPLLRPADTIPPPRPLITVVPGTPTAPALWGQHITITGIPPDLMHLLAFGPHEPSVFLWCGDGHLHPLQRPLDSWIPDNTFVVTLPPADIAPLCPAPYQLIVRIHDALGPVDHSVPITIVAAQDAAGLEALAHLFRIGVSVPSSGAQPPGPPLAVQTGQPLRVALCPPPLTGVQFTSCDGHLLTTAQRYAPDELLWQALAAELVAAAAPHHPAAGTGRALRVAAHELLTAERARVGLTVEAPSHLWQWLPPIGESAHLPPPPATVQVEVAWRIHGVAHPFGTAIDVTEGTLFKLVDPLAPDDLQRKPTLASPVIGLLFRPWIVPATTPPTPPREPAVFFVSAQVRLTRVDLGLMTEWVDVGPVLLPLPVLEMPTVLALFQDSHYHGKVLVCVPADSAIRPRTRHRLTVADVRHRLQAVQQSLEGVQDLSQVATWLCGLVSMLNALPAGREGDIVAIAGNEGTVALDDYTINRVDPIHSRDWRGRTNSMILVGAPNQSVACHNAGGGPHHWAWAYEGHYQLNLDWHLNVRVPSLLTTWPVDETHDPNKVTVVQGRLNTFSDSLAHVAFLP